MFLKSSILGIVVMFMSLSRKVVAFRVPNLSLVVSRSYTHLKNQQDDTSHLHKESDGRPKVNKRVNKIVIDPKTDYKFRECRVFVDNIPLQATWKDLKDHFREAGVNYVSISKDPVTGQSKGCGIVQFDTIEQSTNVVTEMQGSLLKGSPLKVWLDRKRQDTNNQITKTIHSNPNSSMLRGDIKSSSEFEAFKKERSGGKVDRNDRDEGRVREHRRENDRAERSDRSDRSSRESEPRLRDKSGERDGDRDRRPTRPDRYDDKSGRNERNDHSEGRTSRDFEPRSRDRPDSRDRNSDRSTDSRGDRDSRPARVASPERERKAAPVAGDANFKFTPSFFKRDPLDTTIVSAEELSEIEFMVDTRADCRDFGNYETADDIRLRLRNDFRVQCDDVKKMWRILSPLMPDGTPRPTRAH